MRNGSAAGDGSGGRTPERRRKGNRGLSPESVGMVLNDSLRRPGEKEAGNRPCLFSAPVSPCFAGG